METEIKISSSRADLAFEFASELAAMINNAAAKGKYLNVALSGGNTPSHLFTVLANQFADKIKWEFVHFFWGDERCVPPDDPESNYGMTRRVLFEKIKIPASNIHRVRGEDKPQKEAERYSSEILSFTRLKDNLPRFDLIILGLGEDGHTASIFPGNESLFRSGKVCEVAVHPVTGQKRITLTGSVLNNAEIIIFLVTGTAKADIVADIIERPGITDYPAASVEPVHGTLKWYLDIDAASMLSQWA
jgi:6-phosphogluconolactonase